MKLAAWEKFKQEHTDDWNLLEIGVQEFDDVVFAKIQRAFLDGYDAGHAAIESVSRECCVVGCNSGHRPSICPDCYAKHGRIAAQQATEAMQQAINDFIMQMGGISTGQ